MFWECHIVSSSIDKLLDQPAENMKLQDFLDDSDLIQECLTQNPRLFDYLVQKEVMKELIEQMIKCPTDENFHNAQVVSELLSGDFSRIQERLLEREYLDLLYSFLHANSTDNPSSNLNPILASYFARVLITLIIRKPNEILTYFKSCPNFKEDFFNHLYSTSITDVLYRFIADFGEQRAEAIAWYEDIHIMDEMIEEFLTADSIYVQTNIVNLLSEFLRLAFEQPNGIDNDFPGNTTITLSSSSLMMESPLYNGDEESSKLSANINDSENQSKTNETEEKATPLTLAQQILSKSNLEQLFDALGQQPKLVANGCDFLGTILDLFGRYMPAPLCISLNSSFEEQSTSDKVDNERMEINDESNNLSVIKSNETSLKTLSVNAQNPLVRIYLILLEVIPSRLPSLITLLSNSPEPLIATSTSSSSPNQDSSQTVKYQFISEPLGSMRLNLIKFFSKLINIISNDYTGDSIYQIFDSNRFLHILINLFFHHIYNNFLHTHVYLIIRQIFYSNSLAVKQSNDIWTRLSLPQQSEPEPSNSSVFHYTNRCSYKFFQTLLSPSEVNLIERLIDQYELNLPSEKSALTSSSSDDAISASLLQTRFASPNSGHVAQILRLLRTHASIFNNYSSFFQSNDQPQTDENSNVSEVRWQTALNYLIEEEKKWAAMQNNERQSAISFRISSATNFLAAARNAIKINDSSEANQRRQIFHSRTFGGSGVPYNDEEDEEMERLDIDDRLMNSEKTDDNLKLAETKEKSLEPQFPSVFDEQSFWRRHDDIDATKDQTSTNRVPDLFANYRIEPEKSTESNFEELCSLRSNDHGGNPMIFPAQSSSTVQDEVGEGQEEF